MRYLIIGNGAAGVTAAETIRLHDPQGSISIVSAEPYPAYSRPGLAYLLIGEIPKSQLFTRNPEWYSARRLNLVFGKAERLDVRGQRVRLEDGRVLRYDRLLLATGARATPAPYPGANLSGIVYLDTLDGTVDLLRQAKRRRRAVVIGGGITALELCEGLAKRGVNTNYFLRRDRLWGRVFDEAEASLLEERMESHGVNIGYNREITQIEGKRGKVRAVSLKGGGEFPCNLVGMAIGVKPQIELLEKTSVEVDRAVLVDEHMQSNVPNVFAAGDCAQVYDRWTQRHMLDVLWPSAVAEGRVAGMNMAGSSQAYVKGIPFNACLLFGLHITIMGQISPRSDSVSNGDIEVVEHLSRGSSEIWYTYPRNYASAYSREGSNRMRLALNGDNLVGALLMGDQSMADTLCQIIERQINIREYVPQLRAGGQGLKKGLEGLATIVKSAQPAA